MPLTNNGGRDNPLGCPRRRAQRQATEASGKPFTFLCAFRPPLRCGRGRRSAPSLPTPLLVNDTIPFANGLQGKIRWCSGSMRCFHGFSTWWSGFTRWGSELAKWRNHFATWRSGLDRWRNDPGWWRVGSATWSGGLALWRQRPVGWRIDLAQWRPEFAPWGSENTLCLSTPHRWCGASIPKYLFSCNCPFWGSCDRHFHDRR